MDKDTMVADAGELIDRFYGALERKDLDGARACCASDAVFWHNFDGVAQDLEQASAGWQGLFDFFEENRIVDVRRDALPAGVVQRHLFLMRGADGILRGKPCAIFVRTRDGLITRIDEYIDLSSDLAVNDDVQVTAGLPEHGNAL
jgi:ketosteroid isomerase-like protein